MITSRKSIRFLFALLILAMTTTLFFACSFDNSGNSDVIPDVENAKPNMETVYAYAQEAGYTGTMEELIELFKGENAYQLAVAAGYLGTMDEWLDSLVGAAGVPGKDGATPLIGKNGHWWIADVDSGISAIGAKGNGITEFKLFETIGNEDIYLIVFDNNEEIEYEV